jgi:uncharacterized protein YndB with AHSA1/START domain
VIQRVELQTEVGAPRDKVFELLATADGLRRSLDGAELEPRVGGAVSLRLRDGVAVGQVLALDPPQHISFTWDWSGAPLGVPTVVAFDAIDHGPALTHVTVRHVGLPPGEQLELHRELWRHWLKRFQAACRALPREAPVAQ